MNYAREAEKHFDHLVSLERELESQELKFNADETIGQMPDDITEIITNALQNGLTIDFSDLDFNEWRDRSEEATKSLHERRSA